MFPLFCLNNLKFKQIRLDIENFSGHARGSLYFIAKSTEVHTIGCLLVFFIFEQFETLF